MGLKAFMLIVLAIFLATTSKVAARALSQSPTTSLDKGHANGVNDAKFPGEGYDGYYPGYGYWGGYPRGRWYGGLPRN
ncbi:hypothetical protein P3S67_002436 [Capsicum chacoense]